MAYNELIKNFQLIRNYMRQFYVYGFRSRSEYDAKSARSYDDVRRRIDSWLGDYMAFHQTESGRAQFLSVDSRAIAHNPLYEAFKTKSFTDNDIVLHFFLMDLLEAGEWTGFREIVNRLHEEYLDEVGAELYLDESTIRNKLKEYVALGLLEQKKDGKSHLYRKSIDRVDAASWRDAAAFFSEMAPLGVIGSYLKDRKEFAAEEHFGFKHHYILQALDSQILYTILDAMQRHCSITIRMVTRRQKADVEQTVFPVKIYYSTQTGRQYVLAYVYYAKSLTFYRLDRIRDVKIGRADANWEQYRERYEKLRPRAWGVALGERREIDHLEMQIRIEPYEAFLVRRLEREKRNGVVEQVDEHTYRYVVDTHEATELLPWIRTFTGRIESLRCTDPEVERRFWADFEEMRRLYPG